MAPYSSQRLDSFTVMSRMSYWSLVCPQPLLLTGHHGEISALTFGKGSRPVLLCSASADYIIVWNIEKCQRKTQEGKKIVGVWHSCVHCQTDTPLVWLLHLFILFTSCEGHLCCSSCSYVAMNLLFCL